MFRPVQALLVIVALGVPQIGHAAAFSPPENDVIERPRIRPDRPGLATRPAEECRLFEPEHRSPAGSTVDEERSRQVLVLAASRRLALALNEVLWRNGTLERAESSYQTNPVGGGDVLGSQWALAEFLHFQRVEYRALLTAVDRVVARRPGFPREAAILDLLDRMIAFKKANQRFLTIQEKGPTTRELSVMVSRLRASLDEMHKRVTEIEKMLVQAL